MSKWKSALLVAAMGTATALIGCGGDNNTTPKDAPTPPPDAPPGAPVLSITPLTASFGSVVQGNASSAMMFTVSNTGQSDSGSVAATIQGGAQSDFAITSNTCATLAPSATCTV